MTVAPWPSAVGRRTLEAAAAARLALDASEVVLVGRSTSYRASSSPNLEALPTLVNAYVGDGVVALAEPTHPALCESVLLAGARYLDVGRDYAFRIDSDGLRWATTRIEVRLAWFLAPDWPTAIRPSSWLLTRAERAGLLVAIDERLRDSPSRTGVSASRIRLINHGTYTFALSAPETLLPLRRALREPGPLVSSGAECVAAPAGDVAVRLVPVGELRSMAAMRVAGVPSLAAAHSLGENALGSARWTWRDLVVVPRGASRRPAAPHKKAR